MIAETCSYQDALFNKEKQIETITQQLQTEMNNYTLCSI